MWDKQNDKQDTLTCTYFITKQADIRVTVFLIVTASYENSTCSLLDICSHDLSPVTHSVMAAPFSNHRFNLRVEAQYLHF